MPRSWAMLSRTAASSSTMYTAVRAMRSASCQFQGENEPVPARFPVLVPNAAALRFRQAAANCQAEPHALGLGREERVEDAIPVVAGYARAVVRHGDFRLAVALDGGDLDHAGRNIMLDDRL